MENIYTNGLYLQNNPDWGQKDAAWKAGVIAEILALNNCAPKEITEVGCGSGAVLYHLSNLLQASVRYKGYDISAQAISMAKNLPTNNRIEYLNEDWIQESLTTDCLLIIDVLEHVEDYYGFLKNIRKKANSFVFHIPLDLSCRTILKPHVLLQQRNKVGHIHYFTKDLVVWMLKDSGYTIIDSFYTKPFIDTTTAKGFKNSIKKLLRNFSFWIHKDVSASLWGGYSIMILAK
jgi:SAM-dependent methyltransferase